MNYNMKVFDCKLTDHTGKTLLSAFIVSYHVNYASHEFNRLIDLKKIFRHNITMTIMEAKRDFVLVETL